MDNTNIFDFSFQNSQSLNKSENYVLIESGKGKNNNSIYVKAVEFSYIEGIIWDKHREYSDKKKIKIMSADWKRILEGFEEGIELLSNYKPNDDLKDILRFEIYSPRNPLVNIKENTGDIVQLIKDFSEWVSLQIKEEKYISIIKKSL